MYYLYFPWATNASDSCSNVLHYHLKVTEVSTEESTGSSSISGDVDMSEAGSSESTHSQLP